MPPKRFPIAPAIKRAARRSNAASPAFSAQNGQNPPLDSVEASDITPILESLETTGNSPKPGTTPILAEDLQTLIRGCEKYPRKLDEYVADETKPLDKLYSAAFGIFQGTIANKLPREVHGSVLSIATKIFGAASRRGHADSTIELCGLHTYGRTRKINLHVTAIEESQTLKRVRELAVQGNYRAAIAATNAAATLEDEITFAKLAAESKDKDNDGQAGLFLGLISEKKDDTETALRWYSNAVEKGSIPAHGKRAWLEMSTNNVGLGSTSTTLSIQRHKPFSWSAVTFPSIDTDDLGTRTLRDFIFAAANGDLSATAYLSKYYKSLAELSAKDGTRYAAEEALHGKEWEDLLAANRSLEAEK